MAYALSRYAPALSGRRLFWTLYGRFGGRSFSRWIERKLFERFERLGLPYLESELGTLRFCMRERYDRIWEVGTDPAPWQISPTCRLTSATAVLELHVRSPVLERARGRFGPRAPPLGSRARFADSSATSVSGRDTGRADDPRSVCANLRVGVAPHPAPVLAAARDARA